MKFKIILLLVFSFITIGNAQNKKAEKVKELIWGGQEIEVKAIPEKWKDESAVYLFKREKYIYDRPKNSIEYSKIVHERVKLLDQAAVKDFSEFSYSKESSYISYGFSKVTNTFDIGVKIIKANGDEINVDTSEAVEGDRGELKLAITNLEKGDIIDYYLYANTILGENDLYQYKPVESVVGDRYPIIDYQFTLDTEKDFFVNFNTYNGAPKLELIDRGEEKNRKKKRNYQFAMQDVEKNDFPRWFYPLVELPTYKFQVNFARTRKNEKKAYAFIPKEAEEIKTNVIADEIFDFYQDKFKPYGDLGGVERFLKKKTFASNEEKVKEVFYFCRHAYFTNYLEAFVVSEAKIMYPFGYYKNPIFFQEEENFIKFFAAFLKDNKIDYEILIGTKRYNGDIKELLLESNVNFLLKINTENPIYIEYFNPFANINQIDPLLENTNAYALKVLDRKKIEGIETIKIPASTYKDNNITETLKIELSEDLKNAKVHRVSSYIGHNKVEEQGDRFQFYDYVYEDYKKYGTTSLIDRVKKKKDKAKYKKELKALIDKLKDKQKKRFEKQTAAEYDLEFDEYSFKLLKNGRFSKDDPFEFEEHFNFKDDFIKKAGKNQLLLVGELIGSQVDLTDKEKKRTNNIYMNYPRSYTNEIAITIPEGYTIAGLDKLNINVENNSGAFKSNAKIEGNQLIISTFKCYKNHYEPNSNWSDMVKFLDAAYQFTQQKVLLKKL